MLRKWWTSFKWRWSIRISFFNKDIQARPVPRAILFVLNATLKIIYQIARALLQAFSRAGKATIDTVVRIVGLGIAVWLFLQVAHVPFEYARWQHMKGLWQSVSPRDVGAIISIPPAKTEVSLAKTERTRPPGESNSFDVVCRLIGASVIEETTTFRAYNSLSAPGHFFHGFFDLAESTLNASAVFERNYTLRETFWSDGRLEAKIDLTCFDQVKKRVENGECLTHIKKAVRLTATTPAERPEYFGFIPASGCILIVDSDIPLLKPAPPPRPAVFTRIAMLFGLLHTEELAS